MNEIWKCITGYESMYQISNFGRVKSIERTCKTKGGGLRPISEKILNLPYDKDGYRTAYLSKDSNTITHKVHRLVAIAFIENKHNKPQVNHIDGNKSNNHVDNLEWVTNQENQLHAHDIGLFDHSNKTRRKSVQQLTLAGDLVKKWNSATECGRNGYSRECVRDCCLSKQKTYCGYRWVYECTINSIPTI